QMEYDAYGNVVKSIDAEGRETISHYDAQNRVVRTEFQAGVPGSPRVVYDEFTYDASGNPTSHRGVGGDDHITTFDYDAMGRLRQATDAEGQVIEWRHDRWGNLLQDVGPDSNHTYTYDALNRMLTTTDGEGATTTHVYLATTTVTVVIDPLGNRTTMVFDSEGRLLEQEDAMGGVTKREYDGAGNLVAVVDARGLRTEYTYDARNLRTSQTKAAGTADAVTATTTYDS